MLSGVQIHSFSRKGIKRMPPKILSLFPLHSMDAIEDPINNHPSNLFPDSKIRPFRFRDTGMVRIRIAGMETERSQAKGLVQRMYSLHGFKCENIVLDSPHSTTLIAEKENVGVIGTVTIHLDSPGEGLHSDDGYKPEIDGLRMKGKRLCEFNGLAVDPSIRSKFLLAHLFHIAMIYPAKLFSITDCIIEVSYSHARFYERLLGFRRIGEGRACKRVGSVGALLHAEFSSLGEHLQKVGGLMKNAKGDKSFFPYGLSQIEARKVLIRLKATQSSA